MDTARTYYKNKPQRKEGYDYDLPGAYFITICLKNRRSLFGKIVNEVSELFQIGNIADKCWREISEHFKNVELGEFIVMPNHFHGIVFMYDENPVGQTHAFDYIKDKQELTIEEKKTCHIKRCIKDYQL